jgi:hypothetical protein
VTIGEIWNRVAKTRYTRALEVEVVRLRAENRALLNSILGIAGLPPIVVNSPQIDTEVVGDLQSKKTPERIPGIGTASAARKNKPNRNGGLPQQRMIGMGAPVRHRSWHQVNRMLEFDAVRKREPAGDTSQVAIKV